MFLKNSPKIPYYKQEKYFFQLKVIKAADKSMSYKLTILKRKLL